MPEGVFVPDLTRSGVRVRGLGLIWTSGPTRSDRDRHQTRSRPLHRNLTRLVSYVLLTSLKTEFFVTSLPAIILLNTTFRAGNSGLPNVGVQQNDCWKTKNSVVECKASEYVCEKKRHTAGFDRVTVVHSHLDDATRDFCSLLGAAVAGSNPAVWLFFSFFLFFFFLFFFLKIIVQYKC